MAVSVLCQWGSEIGIIFFIQMVLAKSKLWKLEFWQRWLLVNLGCVYTLHLIPENGYHQQEACYHTTVTRYKM